MAYSDEEDSDENILITLITSITHGSIEVLAHPKGSTERNRSRRVRVGDSFTQQDINDGAVG